MFSFSGRYNAQKRHVSCSSESSAFAFTLVMVDHMRGSFCLAGIFCRTQLTICSSGCDTSS